MSRFGIWTKVTDRLPRVYKSVIIYTSDGCIRQSHLMTNIEFEGRKYKTMWADEYLRPGVKVTHWMEEPEPPIC